MLTVAVVTLAEVHSTSAGVGSQVVTVAVVEVGPTVAVVPDGAVKE